MSRKHSRPSRSLAARLGSGLITLVSVLATVAGVGYLAPTFFGYERYVITGGSMSGTFEKGSIAFEEPVPVEELKVGDVITYLPPPDSGLTTLVTHRIIKDTTLKSGTRRFQTQGDANPDPDPWKFSLTAKEQPVVRHTVPYVGWVFVGLADRQVRIMVIGVPATLIALGSMVQLARAMGAARRDRKLRPVVRSNRDPLGSV